MGAVTLQLAPGNPTLQQRRGEEHRSVCVMATKLTQEQIAEYRGVFEMFDEEENGDVKMQELERRMSLMGILPTKRELCQMAKDVDKDGKGIFNCESFLGLMALDHQITQNQDAGLRAVFKVFDEDAKGYIDWNTLKYVLTNAGEPLNEIEAEQMMKEGDNDGDGAIDYEEFVAMMTWDLFKMR
ncbi:LOW QUALITY PROTEIN: calglandulin-like [Limanda limanda]|uniref:LOW QUALITY PROTEIN: calglandulin-like n=1 Tax=Limanda limanda TaxID=27771 RepID=UPI0029C86818|nr:LOW QUALITY PROTEIN: calglandulin-like [Limanda limanda]